jgi:hypothetical protein
MKSRAYIAASYIMLSFPAVASDAPEAFQLHAFAALNPIITTDNNFFGNTQDSVSLEFWELGINASWRPRPELLLSAQATSRRAGEEDDGSPRLDYGLISYTVVNAETTRAGIRVGRVLNPLGLYNETRDVAFTRHSILLPQSIYFDRTRDIALSGDGVQFFSNHTTDFGDFYLQFNAGFQRTDDDGRSERALLGPNALGDFEPRLSFLGRILYEVDGGRFRFALSGGSVKLDFEAKEPVDPVPNGRFDFRPVFLSAQYNAEKYTITSEFGPRILKVDGFGGRGETTTGESFYIEGLYRFSPNWEAYLRFDSLITDRTDRQGNTFAARDPLNRPHYTRFAKDLTAGITWRLNRAALIRAEYHYVDGTAWLPLADNIDNPLERYWSIFALQFALRF